MAGVVWALALLTLALPVKADPTDSPDEAAARDADYVVAKKAIGDKRWDEAVRAFKRAEVRLPDNADVQNYLGYAYRNLGQLDFAFVHYRKALALDPRHRGAHEYIGEAFLMQGDLAGAQRHLAALTEICLLPCEEKDDLAKAIAAYQAKAKAP